MVDFSGHISKAARITRPGMFSRDSADSSDRAKKAKQETQPNASYESHLPPSPQKYIHYEFIDESASIMSPTYSFDAQSPSPVTLLSPIPSFNLLLKAAEEEGMNHKPAHLPLTPPQSPPESICDHKSIILL